MTHRFPPLQNELHRLLEEYLASPRPREQTTTPPPPTDLDRAGWTPPIDVYETPDETLVVVDVPGVDTSRIDLTIAGKFLTLRGVREPAPLPGGEALVRERKAGPFHRVVEVSSNIDADAIMAQANDGVLTIRLPKRSVGKSRTIPIRPS